MGRGGCGLWVEGRGVEGVVGRGLWVEGRGVEGVVGRGGCGSRGCGLRVVGVIKVTA